MRLIRTLILLGLLLYFLAFFSENNQIVDISVPFTEYQASINLSSYSVIALFIGSLFGFLLKRTNKRDFMLRERALRDEVKNLQTQKKIYESELKVQNQLLKK